MGRSEDIFWFEDRSGRREFLHPLAIEGFCIEGLLDYQFLQTGNDAFEMRAQTSEKADREAIRGEMQRQMRGILAKRGSPTCASRWSSSMKSCPTAAPEKSG